MMLNRTTGAQDADFTDALAGELHSVSIDATFVFEWVRENFTPEDIFTFENLCSWAENNGYAIEE